MYSVCIKANINSRVSYICFRYNIHVYPYMILVVKNIYVILHMEVTIMCKLELLLME